MDPISHGIIGIAVSSFSGEPVAISSAITIGSMLGAMSPDLDFVIRIFKDDVKYLEHHRGFSHSIPMLLAFSLSITSILAVMPFNSFSFFQTLLWTFFGALSHTAFDILNSYGARLFQQKIKGNILTLYDPFVLMVCFALIARRHNDFATFAISGISISTYFVLRLLLREHAKAKLMSYFGSINEIRNISVMPSLKLFYKWDFIVECESVNIVGQFTPFKKQPVKIIKVLEIENPELMKHVMATSLGHKFSAFSPNVHIEILESNQDFMVLRLIDMRYFFRNTFLHQGTLILDANLMPIESIFHPYKLSNAVPVAA